MCAGFDELKQTLCNEFSDGIRNKLPASPMKGPPMRITLIKDAISSKIHTAREIPKHLQEEAKDIIIELMIMKFMKFMINEKEIIARVYEPTEWTSAAFFVSKPNAIKGSRSIRLVTDLSKLNHFIVRPVHPFPSVQNILASVKSSNKVFAKMDAIQGYHQVALDTPSSYLTTFLLPCGRF